MKNIRLLLLSLLLAASLFTIFSVPGEAQIDPSNRIYLFENGIRVGEVYVPERAEGQTEYVEHWVLYPNYLYPGPRFIGTLQIVPTPSEQPYEGETDFFKRVPFEKGSKYIRVTAQESATLPVVR